MVIVSTTGYIIDIIHPYLARNNDAMILRHFLETSGDDLLALLGSDGVILADRGFRDVTKFLEGLGIRCVLPSFLSKDQKSMSVRQSNETRKLTKVRWVVESAIGRLKRNLLFRNTVPIGCLPTIAIDLRISAALINRFRTPLVTDDENSDRWAAQMLRRMTTQNILRTRFETGEIVSRKKAKWHTITNLALVDFPVLSEDDMRDLCFGTFQVNQGRHYISDQLHSHGSHIILVSRVETGLIQISIKSRHRSQKIWRVFVRFAPEQQVSFSQQFDIDIQIPELTQHSIQSTFPISQQSGRSPNQRSSSSDSTASGMSGGEEGYLDESEEDENHLADVQKVQLASSQLDDTPPAFKKILGWYCTCLAGSRTVGMCSHAASIIWYLGFGRHQPERKQYKWAKFFGDSQKVRDGSEEESGSSISDTGPSERTQNVLNTFTTIIEIEEGPPKALRYLKMVTGATKKQRQE